LDLDVRRLRKKRGDVRHEEKRRPGLYRDAVLPLLIPACAEISCGGGTENQKMEI
jgi:hypothetical protein